MKFPFILVPAFVLFASLTYNPERGGKHCTDARYTGRDRRGAKTHFALAPEEDFKEITDLVKTLPSDHFMLDSTDLRKQKEDMRLPMENRNVRIGKVYLYAVKKEADNDYHLILENQPSGNVFFTAEVSGLPARSDPAYRDIEKVRAVIEDTLKPPCSGNYHLCNDRMISISGSMFYDVDHKPGIVGPAGHHPVTAWEIHPVSAITFR